jgi:adenylosuccinate synthase
MIAFYDVNIQYNLEELEKNFESIEDLEKLDFIDSEEYLAQKNQVNQYYEELKVHCRCSFGTHPFVTSSNTTAAGACTGLEFTPTKSKKYTIFKHTLLV